MKQISLPVSRLSTSYDSQYLQLLKHFQSQLLNNNIGYKNNKYSFLYPSFGNQSTKENKIIIYGQCINGGWEPEFKIEEELTDEFIYKGWEHSNTLNPNDKTPLDWINNKWIEYKMYRSFFWNVSYKLTNRLVGEADYVNSDSWCQHLVWSNLMKIGNVQGGNPNEDEHYAQIDLSVKLFLQEIEEIKPEYVIMLTGLGFSEDFTKALGLKQNVEDKKFVKIASKIGNTKYILTYRPYMGNNEACVSEIIEYLNKL
jgi:hypothetical protein